MTVADLNKYPFFSKLNEQTDLWQRLGQTTKPILLYGMGNGAGKIIEALALLGKTIDGVFASDDFVRGHSFAGHKVLSYSQAVDQFGDFIVLVAFGTQKPEVIANIVEIAAKQELCAPNVPLFGQGLFDLNFVAAHGQELQAVYDLLADEESRWVFLAICDYSLSGKIDYLLSAASPKAEAFRLLCLGKDEVYVDLGAYNGDTVLEFLAATSGKYRQIVAVEPDPKNCYKLQKTVVDYNNTICLNQGIWQSDGIMAFDAKSGRHSTLQNLKASQSSSVQKEIPVICLDSIWAKYCPDYPPTYIKMDVEGAEQQALLGGAKLLADHKPKLWVSAYHRNEDLFALPLLIAKANPDYCIYLRRQPYIPGWENNFYAI